MTDRRRAGPGRNAAWNIVGGLAPALIALLLPPVLTRTLTPAGYGIWAIILQVTTIVAAIGTVAQLATARFVAVADATGDGRARDGHVASALALTLVLAGGLIGFAIVVGLHMPLFFPGLPAGLWHAGGWSLVLVSIGVATTLPGGVIAGRFIGEQRAAVPNAILFGGRLLQGALVAAVAFATADLVAIAVAHLAGNVVIFAVQIVVLRRAAGGLPPRSFVSRHAIADLCRFSATMCVWQVATLVINGINLIVLGGIDFSSVPFFAVAGTLVTIVVGTAGAVHNAFLPIAARIYTVGLPDDLARFLSHGIRIGLSVMLALGIPLLVSSEPLLRLWLGHAYSGRSAPIVTILLGAALVRLSIMLYIIIAVATGRHTKAILGPILEAVANLSLSLLLGHWLGAIGVAYGALLSAWIGVAAWIILDPLRAATGDRPAWRVLGQAFMRPVLILVPLAVAGLLMPPWVHDSWIGLGCVSVVAAALTWSVVLLPGDRAATLAWARRMAMRRSFRLGNALG